MDRERSLKTSLYQTMREANGEFEERERGRRREITEEFSVSDYERREWRIRGEREREAGVERSMKTSLYQTIGGGNGKFERDIWKEITEDYSCVGLFVARMESKRKRSLETSPIHGGKEKLGEGERLWWKTRVSYIEIGSVWCDRGTVYPGC